MKLDIDKIRSEFPIFSVRHGTSPLVYFDNAATTQKPLSVISRMDHYYQHFNANVHRGSYHLAEDSTQEFERARDTIRDFIHANQSRECVWVRGTTEAINLVASCWQRDFLNEGDEILISEMEHHSNIVPWQLACHYSGASLKVVKCTDKGDIDIDDFLTQLNSKTKLVAIAHVSNVLGTINDIKTLIHLSHENNTPILIDGAQAPSHLPINVSELDCDFYAFSGHKLYGPTGIGVLFGKQIWLDKMPPYQGGGEMIQSVAFDKTIYNTLPYKFEAGTPAIAEAIGLASAVDYISQFPPNLIHQYETELLNHAVSKIQSIDEIEIFGDPKLKVPIVSFHIDGIHPHDLATFLDSKGIAIRAGQLCAEPLLHRFGYHAISRLSLGLYNTVDEIDYFIENLILAIRFFKKHE